MLKYEWDTESLSPSQLRIADYINKHTQQVLLSTEQEIAEAVQVSIATVSRFWRTIGYKNFKEFKVSILREMEVSPAQKLKNTRRKLEGSMTLSYPTLEASFHHLHQTLEHLDNVGFRNAVHLLNTAHKVFIFAPGPSVGLGKLMQYRMKRFGIDILLLEKGGSELLEDLLHLAAEDVVIIFSFLQLLPEAKVILDHQKQVRYRTVMITDLLVSTFSEDADVLLYASRGEVREFHSMIAPTFLVENLIVAVGMEKNEENIKRMEMLTELRTRYEEELPR